ncbi:MAG: WbuC family cupin fold metalloprotein [Pseudomonadota bacterium]|nr:MAG: WbuC family cupin fold metalloprotein [Pseudomonadota bacterium]
MRILTQDQLAKLSAEAASSARRRKNLNLHPQLSDPIQRLCNAFEPGTYVRPHRHAGSDRWELFMALMGAAVVLTFDDAGVVRERVVIAANGANRGIEIPAGAWHALAALTVGTVLFEVKPGPYSPLTDKDFAPWAPPENEASCSQFERWYRNAQPGDRPPAM